VLNSSIRQGLQKRLGALGAKFGIGVSKIQRLDGQTEPGALWVRLAGQPDGDSDPTKAVAAIIPALNRGAMRGTNVSRGLAHRPAAKVDHVIVGFT
jgi:hypothetical protein